MCTLPYLRVIDLESRSQKIAEGIYVTDRLTWSVVTGEDTTKMEPGTQIMYQVDDTSWQETIVERIG